MNRWTGTNLMLGVLAAVLLALHLWPTAAPSRDTLTTLDARMIDAIRVERDDRLQLALQRTADGWQLSHPVAAAARPARVQQLLAISRAPVQAELADPADLAEFGLQRPQAVVQFDNTRVTFGARDPTQRSRYVLTEAGLRVIDDVYFNLLTLPAKHFVRD